ncbi:hypothetical protein LCGC14_2957300, partial [marine sediment metagenome]
MTTDIQLRTTRVYDDNARAYLDPTVRRALNEGGTSSSKTYSILQILDLVAEHAKEPLIISVVSESLPHLKKGAIRDFFNIRDEDEKNNPNWNMTDHVYTYPLSRAKLEFFGADEAGKVRGPRRDILFLNEGNNIPWKAAQGLDIRTRRFVFVDWNPVSDFWVHEYESGGKMVQGWLHQPGNAYIHSTYLDGLEVIPKDTIEKIEAQKDIDPNWWHVFGEGLPGMVEGLVYAAEFGQADIPDGGYEFFGLDWGYSVDPTVLVRLVIKGDKLYGEELLYEKGLSNADIAHLMVELGIKKHHDIIWADNEDPKSIDEICSYGFNMKGAPKGPGSVEYGHQRVRQYKHYWTQDSL